MLKGRYLSGLFSGTKSPSELASRFAGLRSGSGGRKGTFILPIVALSTKIGNREDNER